MIDIEGLSLSEEDIFVLSNKKPLSPAKAPLS